MSYQLCRQLGKLAQNATVFSTVRANGTLELFRLNRSQPKIILTNFQVQQCAVFSTSKKKHDTDITTVDPTNSNPPTKTDNVDSSNVTGKKKHWQTLGFDWYDQEKDQNDANFVMFVTVTIGVVLVGFFLAYIPDVKHRDWSQREAYIEISRREALGLPHIDPDLVPQERINLPSEEELGEFNIVI